MNSRAATFRRCSPQRRPMARRQARTRSSTHVLISTPRLPRDSHFIPFRVLKRRSQPAKLAS